jgi:hypothetical protein
VVVAAAAGVGPWAAGAVVAGLSTAEAAETAVARAEVVAAAARAGVVEGAAARFASSYWSARFASS